MKKVGNSIIVVILACMILVACGQQVKQNDEYAVVLDIKNETREKIMQLSYDIFLDEDTTLYGGGVANADNTPYDENDIIELSLSYSKENFDSERDLDKVSIKLYVTLEDGTKKEVQNSEIIVPVLGERQAYTMCVDEEKNFILKIESEGGI